MTSESFEIKSSYENLNNLSKGEIIKNGKYKCCLEMLIKNHLNNINNFTEENIKEMLTKISAFNKEKEFPEKGKEKDYSEKRTKNTNNNNNNKNTLIIILIKKE